MSMTCFTRSPSDRACVNRGDRVGTSRCVFRVQLHVLVREIAGPEPAETFAEAELQPQLDLTILLEIGRSRARIEWLWRPLLVEEKFAHPQRQVAFLELHAGIPRGRDESPPVRVGPENRRLDQGA